MIDFYFYLVELQEAEKPILAIIDNGLDPGPGLCSFTCQVNRCELSGD